MTTVLPNLPPDPPGKPGKVGFPEGVKRGVCRVCGAPATNPYSTYCEAHTANKKSAGTTSKVPPTTTVPPDQPAMVINQPGDTKVEPTGDEKERALKARTVTISNWILHDGNVVLVKQFARFSEPIPAVNFYEEKVAPDGKSVQFSITPLGQRIVFSEWQASILASAVANLEDSAPGKLVTTMATPYAPYLYLAAALGVVAWHGSELMRLRRELAISWQNAQVSSTTPPEQTGQTPKAEPETPPSPVAHEQPETGEVNIPDTVGEVLNGNMGEPSFTPGVPPMGGDPSQA
jgi:hypothetical protein